MQGALDVLLLAGWLAGWLVDWMGGLDLSNFGQVFKIQVDSSHGIFTVRFPCACFKTRLGHPRPGLQSFAQKARSCGRDTI